MVCKLGMEGDVLGGCFWQRRNQRRNPPRDEEARENGVKALRIPRLMEFGRPKLPLLVSSIKPIPLSYGCKSQIEIKSDVLQEASRLHPISLLLKIGAKVP